MKPILNSLDGYVLSTGKVIYPKCADIILFELGKNDSDTPGHYVYEVTIDHYDSPDLTKEEARELALYISELWLQYAKDLE